MAERPSLDPDLRKRLLLEARTPWRSLRRALWWALFASAGLGGATMGLRAASGDSVPLQDLAIQAGALGLLGLLLWFDRNQPQDPAQLPLQGQEQGKGP
jgi:hypothetical protein